MMDQTTQEWWKTVGGLGAIVSAEEQARRWEGRMRAAARRAHQEGHSVAAIARAAGVSRGTVYTWLAEAGGR